LRLVILEPLTLDGDVAFRLRLRGDGRKLSVGDGDCIRCNLRNQLTNDQRECAFLRIAQ